MKQRLALPLALVLAAALLCGCKQNTKTILPLPEGPDYVAEYMDVTDVRHIGHALDTAATRMPVKWENPATGYQFSMMVFTTDSAMGTTTRNFTVLVIDPDSQGETLDLRGTSSQKNEWKIVALAPPAPVGAVGRMPLDESPAPKASTSSGADFKGFMIDD